MTRPPTLKELVDQFYWLETADRRNAHAMLRRYRTQVRRAVVKIKSIEQERADRWWSGYRQACDDILTLLDRLAGTRRRRG